eukprot:scaffold10570_cov176-Amphora_coffeaeformis.AAC.29
MKQPKRKTLFVWVSNLWYLHTPSIRRGVLPLRFYGRPQMLPFEEIKLINSKYIACFSFVGKLCTLFIPNLCPPSSLAVFFGGATQQASLGKKPCTTIMNEDDTACN